MFSGIIVLAIAHIHWISAGIIVSDILWGHRPTSVSWRVLTIIISRGQLESIKCLIPMQRCLFCIFRKEVLVLSIGSFAIGKFQRNWRIFVPRHQNHSNPISISESVG